MSPFLKSVETRCGRPASYWGGVLEPAKEPGRASEGLQHITDEGSFDAAVGNLMRMLRPAGMVAVLEYAPLRVLGRMPGYMRARSSGQWVGAFTSRGCRLRAETGVRFLGHGPYMLAVKLARRLRPDTDKETPPPALNALRASCQAVDLALARIPGITLTGDVRLLCFEKAS